MPTPHISEREARFDELRGKIGLLAAPLCLVATILLPIPSLSPQAHTLAGISIMTVILWVTEAIPLAVAALLGPAMAAMLGVTGAKDAFAPFAHPLIFLFMGGFMLAGALSRQGFDRRTALWLISRPIVAGSPSRALMALSAIAFVFSMWISNTATTAMLIPVAMGLRLTMRETLQGDEAAKRQLDRYAGGMCLALAYCASLGGATTPIGTAPNVIAIGMLGDEVGVRLDFLQWLAMAMPAAAPTAAAVVWFTVRKFRPPVPKIAGLRREVDRQLKALGPIKPGEWRTLMVFGLAIIGWLTPSVLKLALGGQHPWAQQADAALDEGVVAIVCASLLFFVPSGNRRVDRVGDERRDPLLTWNEAQSMDWGTLLLLGGGMALGRLTFQTGLADAIGRGLIDLAGPIASHPLGLTAAAVLLVIFMTELTSNTATTTMMLPVLIGVARSAQMDAAPTAIAVTLAASFAFMLPVSTPPNAIAYGTRLIRIDSMIRLGVRLDVVGYAIIMACAAFFVPMIL